MNRPVVIYSIFAACVLLAGGALAWVSDRVIDLDRRDAAAQRQAELEESVRLALWRMDSALGPIIAQENARPWFEYDSYYNPRRVYKADFTPIVASDVQLPSPLLDNRSPLVKLYFQVDETGRVTSPQVPGPHQPPGRSDPQRDQQLAEATGNLGVMMALAEPEVFWSFAPGADRPRVLSIDPAGLANQPSRPLAAPAPRDFDRKREENAGVPAGGGAPDARADAAVPSQKGLIEAEQQEFANAYEQKKLGRDRNTVEQQELRANFEWQQRQRITEQSKGYGKLNRYQEDFAQQAPQLSQAQAPSPEAAGAPTAALDGKAVKVEADARSSGAAIAGDALGEHADAGAEPPIPDAAERQSLVLARRGADEAASTSPAPEPAQVHEGPMEAKWIGGELILLRRVRIDGRSLVQGVWLDWPAVRDWLLEQVRYDLLPNAELAPAGADAHADSPAEVTRLLASAPVQLIERRAAGKSIASLEPISAATRKSLLIAWGGAIVALIAIYTLLRGTLALSERRAAFVSAVTHELRTPLTTFKMYTQMLAEGMVADEPTRRRYLDTLRTEADRLGHLVENVLAYARLERNRLTSRFQSLGVVELVDRVRERLAQRAEQAGMTLAIEFDDRAADAEVRTDAAAVEQVLFNLVDNACKYAAEANDRRVHLRVEAGTDEVRLSVIDHGPGVCADAKPTLFQPFTKSAHRAATSAPGVGLGLALCRRLARRLGGNLVHNVTAGEGCRFDLTLPRGR